MAKKSASNKGRTAGRSTRTTKSTPKPKPNRKPAPPPRRPNSPKRNATPPAAASRARDVAQAARNASAAARKTAQTALDLLNAAHTSHVAASVTHAAVHDAAAEARDRTSTPPGKKSKRPRRAATPAPTEDAPADLSDDIVAVAAATLPPPFTVVGVGASAGGLEAMSDLLSKLPPDAGAAVVLIAHLSPDHPSALSTLLTAAGHIPVEEATEGVAIQPNRVYVIPPNARMAVDEGKLHLIPRGDERTHFLPIDAFFRSLAEYAQDRAVGVVLSGADSDGAAGLRDIKGAGGITIAQEPRSAKYDAMPRAAVTAGVDMVLSPPDIAREIVRISHGVGGPAADRTPHGRHARTEELAAAPDEDLKRVFHLLRGATGVDFTHYKMPTIRRRLHRRMVLHKLATVEAYVKFLQGNPEELHALYSDLLIHVTRFFRDPDSFDALKQKVFPKLVDARRGEQPVRIWIPGCSTGEEAYSVAIALLEFLGDNAHGVPVQIFATDVSESAIDQARAGLYPENISADVSPDRLRRFFTKVDGSYRIAKAVRDACVFARQDLTRDPPFSRQDLILCRNVLIYLGPVLQRRLMGVFHYAMKPTGFLMLGSAETIGGHTDLFSVVDKRHKLYAKKAAAIVSRADVDFGGLAEHHLPGGGGRPDPARKPPGIDARPTGNVQSEANRVILSRFAPPGVIVDNELRIIQFRGQTGPFLEPAPGEASLNLLKMAREGLLYGLRSALHDARKNDRPARKDGLRVKRNGHTMDVAVEVIPLLTPGDSRHFLVLFEDRGHLPAAAAAAAEGKPAKSKKQRPLSRSARAAAAAAEADERVARLQQELAASREYMQSIIQDLEATNEELQSANEEILSSNEELQSTNEELDTAKEELQSTNEELNTVNEELQGRNEELSRVNSDLVNLLGSVQIAIVMVAADLKVRRFTPMAEKVLNLIPTDVGRPISDIKPNIDVPELEKLITEAIDTVTIKEREVRDRAGNTFLLRVRPYKNVENRIDGAVLALFDVGSERRATADLAAGRSAREFVEAVVNTAPTPLLALAGDLSVRWANRAFLETFDVRPDAIQGQEFFDLAEHLWDVPRLRALLDDVLPKHAVVEEYVVEDDFPTLGRRRMILSARQLKYAPGAAPGEELILLAFRDETDDPNDEERP